MLNDNNNILNKIFLSEGIPNFYHPGMLGDIIYSIPFCLATIGIYNKQMLNNNKKYNLILDSLISHGNDIQQKFEQLISIKMLLSTQSYFNEIFIHKEYVDFYGLYNAIDLGQIRKGLVNMDKGNIIERYNFIYRTLKHYNQNDPWIVLDKEHKYDYFNDKIIVFRSSRYQNSNIKDYSILQSIKKKIVFISFSEEEYQNFNMKNISFIKINNFLQVAHILNNCAFCIGNQTAFFAVAEALKIPRMLQMSSEIPDVIPCGDFSNEFVSMDDFQLCLQKYLDYFF